MMNNNIIQKGQDIMYKNAFKNIILLVAVSFLGIVLYLVSYNEKALTSKTFLYSITAIIPLIIAFMFALKPGMVVNDKFNPYLGIGMISVSLFIGFMFYIYSNFSATSLLFATFILNILVFFMVIVALTFLFNVFSNYINRSEGTLKFILQFIFYIPCLLNDLLGYLKYQLHITPKVTYILIVLEILLILFYLYIPSLFSKMILSKGHILQKEPFLLIDKQMAILTNSEITLKNPKEDIMNNSYRKTYSISMWIQINPGNVGNIENNQTIFSYGYTNTKNNINHTKPMIKYSYDTVGGKDLYDIYFTSDNVSPIQIHLPNQKWNHFVFNYNDNNTSDLFINGSLERTFDLRIKEPEYSLEDTITIGSKNTSLYGFISNIIYYKNVLTPNDISMLWILGHNF